MILISKASFPKFYVKEAAKAFTELPKLPSSMKRCGPFFQIEEGKDIQIIIIYEVSSSSFNEVKKFLTKRYTPFNKIDGFKFSIEQWVNMMEAVEVLNTMTAGAS